MLSGKGAVLIERQTILFGQKRRERPLDKKKGKGGGKKRELPFSSIKKRGGRRETEIYQPEAANETHTARQLKTGCGLMALGTGKVEGHPPTHPQQTNHQTSLEEGVGTGKLSKIGLNPWPGRIMDDCIPILDRARTHEKTAALRDMFRARKKADQGKEEETEIRNFLEGLITGDTVCRGTFQTWEMTEKVQGKQNHPSYGRRGVAR